MSEPEKTFIISFIASERDIENLLGTLENASSACETFAAESSENGLDDAMESWERDAKNLDALARSIKDGRRDR